jgi:16S rRNA (cytosine967-C5)-methyltransferase
MPVSPARTAAFDILMRVEQTDAYASELLHSSRFAKLSPADHGLLTELVMGVLRWRGLMDAKIAEHSSQAIAKLDLEVLTALRLGAYQIAFLDRVPKHAAVNESVELVKRAHKRSATGLVNAVLRKIDRVGHLSEEHEEVGSAGGNDQNNTHPFAKNAKRVGQPDRSPLSSFPRLDPSASLRAGLRGRPSPYGLSHPQWLVERWEQTYGADAAYNICEYNQSAPQTVVRVGNPEPRSDPRERYTPRVGAGAPTRPVAPGAATGGELSQPARTRASGPTRASALKQFVAQGIQLEPGKLLAHASIVAGGDVSRNAAFREHGLVIQDEASQLVALLVGKGKTILDCCAAPGGKTGILAEENPDAVVIAMELHPRRAALLKKLVAAPNVRIISADVRAMPIHKQFDRILVDAPCSGTGTLARNPEIKWRLKAEDLLRLQTYQVEILRSAMKHATAGGRIVYSTCSLEPEENERVIEKALAENSEFRVIDVSTRLFELQADGELAWKEIESLVSGPYLRTIPGVHPYDGFFAAILEKA